MPPAGVMVGVSAYDAPGTHAIPDSKQVQEILETIAARERIAGIAVGLCVGDQSLVTSVGRLTPESTAPLPPTARFAIACVTKLLVALVTSGLLQAGELELDASVDEFLPELRGTQRGRTQLLRHLLSLTTGYQDLAQATLAANRFGESAAALQLFPPGSLFSYEHTAYWMLGEILHRVCNRDLQEFLKEQICEPLNLVAGDVTQPDPAEAPAIVGQEFNAALGGFRRAPGTRPSPSGAQSNLTLSVGDMLELARALAAPGDRQRVGALSSQAVRAIQVPYSRLPLPVEGTGATGLPTAIGLGCAHYANGLYGFDGGSIGQVCSVRFHPGTQTCMTVGLNVASPKTRAAVIDALLQSMGWTLEDPAAACRSTYDFDLEQLPGAYLGGNGSTLTVTAAPAQFLFDFSFEGSATPLRITTTYDRYANSLAIAGPGRMGGLSVFRDPGGTAPCVGLGVIMFRRRVPSS